MEAAGRRDHDRPDRQRGRDRTEQRALEAFARGVDLRRPPAGGLAEREVRVGECLHRRGHRADGEPTDPPAGHHERVQRVPHLHELDERRVRGRLDEPVDLRPGGPRGRRSGRLVAEAAHAVLELGLFRLQPGGVGTLAAGDLQPTGGVAQGHERPRGGVVLRSHRRLGQGGRPPALAPPEEGAGPGVHGVREGEVREVGAVARREGAQLGAAERGPMDVQGVQTATARQQHPSPVPGDLALERVRQPAAGAHQRQPVGAVTGPHAQRVGRVDAREPGGQQPGLSGLVGTLGLQAAGDGDRRRTRTPTRPAAGLARP